MTSRADALLSGPRGRRLCLELIWGPGWWLRDGADPSASLADRVAATDLSEFLRSGELLDALLGSVDNARYWQPPDDEDQLLAVPGTAELLAPVAEAVVAAPASLWWSEPLETADQHAVRWPDDGEPVPPPTTGARAALVQWRTDTLLADEGSARERSADPWAAASGAWWSTPALSRLPVTSRAVPGIAVDRSAPVGLLLTEDSWGWETGRSWPVRPPSTALRYEVTGPADWVALVERFPLDVSSARRSVWWHVTGFDGRWLVPDWAAVAAEHDAVHLTVDGYLSTAGRALDVPGTGARTVLAGWDPDATWWLTDVLPGLGDPTDWRRDDPQGPWEAVP